MESSPACWAAYGEVLAREYSDQAFYAVHRMSVDAYAVQHPGQPSPQTIQSVAVHLIRLCLQLERALSPEQANAAMLLAVSGKDHYTWLTPPTDMGPITIADVQQAKDVTEHVELVKRWAKSAWEAWTPHHATIREWMPRLGTFIQTP